MKRRRDLPLGQLIILGFDASLQRAVNGIVLQQVGESLGIGEIVDRDELHFGIAERRAQDVTSDSAKPVDSNSYSHDQGNPPRKNRPVIPGQDDGDSIDGLSPCQALQKWVTPRAERGFEDITHSFTVLDRLVNLADRRAGSLEFITS